MSVSPRLIRRRIRSVSNTKKITKAMELVAAAKMRKTVSATLATRPYADAAWRAVREMARVTDPGFHPLLRTGSGEGKVLLVVFMSDRGLCGGYNSQMGRTVAAFLRGREAADIVAVGKKAQAAMRRSGRPIVAAFEDLTNNPRVTDIRPITDLAIHDFMAGLYDEVHIAYTDYRSALTQVPKVARLLPLHRPEGLGDAAGPRGAERAGRSAAEDLDLSAATGREYAFEPSPAAVLDALLPRIVEVQVYQALLEASASEHSARMAAMRSATDAAGDMIGSLTLAYNQARQANITREIAEISSGKAALE
jgi:F-type H+-transporting ATPase subunit gamma